MDTMDRGWSGARLRRFAAALAAGVALLFALSVAKADASAYQVCGYLGLGGYQAGGAYCNYGSVLPIDYIEIGAGDGSMAVYRATAGYLGAPSASGQEYYNSGGYFAQSFHCYAGYPAEHNRHSYSVYVYYVTAYDCI